MLQAFVFEKVGLVVGDIYFQDPNPGKGQEGPEHGVRLELRKFNRGEPRGTVYAAVPIEAATPIWRVDLLESVDGTPGSYNRTHHHPKFQEWHPTSRKYERDLSSDPLGWLEKQLTDLPAILERAGFPADTADQADADGLRELAPTIASTAGMMLEKVRAGELGRRPDPVPDGIIRNGWL